MARAGKAKRGRARKEKEEDNGDDQDRKASLPDQEVLKDISVIIESHFADKKEHASRVGNQGRKGRRVHRRRGSSSSASGSERGDSQARSAQVDASGPAGADPAQKLKAVRRRLVSGPDLNLARMAEGLRKKLQRRDYDGFYYDQLDAGDSFYRE